MCSASFSLDWTYPSKARTKGISEQGVFTSDNLYRTSTLKMGTGRGQFRIWDIRTRFALSCRIVVSLAMDCATSRGKASIVAKHQDLCWPFIQSPSQAGEVTALCSLPLPNKTRHRHAKSILDTMFSFMEKEVTLERPGHPGKAW